MQKFQLAFIQFFYYEKNKKFLFFSFLFSCTKESVVSQKTKQTENVLALTQSVPQEPTIENGMIKFSDAANFVDYINYMSKNNVDAAQWETNKNFNSARKAFVNDPVNIGAVLPIDDKYLSTVLNTDNMVIVAPWIFRLNPNNRTVYVLNTSKQSKLGILKGSTTPSDPDILAYSFDDEVLDILSTGQSPTGAKGSCHATVTAPGSIDNWMTVESIISTDGKKKTNESIKAHYKYNGWGILKTLYVHFIHIETTYKNSGTPANPIWGSSSYKTVDVMSDLTDTWAYTIKGASNSVSGSYTATVINGKLTGFSKFFSGDHQWNYYQGGKCLSAFSMNEIVLFESSLVPGKVESIDLGSL